MECVRYGFSPVIFSVSFGSEDPSLERGLEHQLCPAVKHSLSSKSALVSKVVSVRMRGVC